MAAVPNQGPEQKAQHKEKEQREAYELRDQQAGPGDLTIRPFFYSVHLFTLPVSSSVFSRESQCLLHSLDYILTFQRRQRSNNTPLTNENSEAGEAGGGAA